MINRKANFLRVGFDKACNFWFVAIGSGSVSTENKSREVGQFPRLLSPAHTPRRSRLPQTFHNCSFRESARARPSTNLRSGIFFRQTENLARSCRSNT